MRARFLFPLLRLLSTACALIRALLFLVALIMLALGLQPPLLLFAVIQRGSRKSDIESSRGEIIWARIVFFRPQCFLETFDGVRSYRLDRKEHTSRRSARGFGATLLEKRESHFNTDNAGHAGPAFSARAEGSQPNDLSRGVEQRAAGTAGVNVDIGHDGVLLDFADDAGGDDLIKAERTADGEHPLAFLDWGSAARSPIQRRGRSVWQGGHVYRQQCDVLLGIGGNQLGRDFVRPVKLHSQILRITYDVLVRQDEALRVHEESRAVPRFAPHGNYGVFQPLELLGKVVGGGLCRGYGSNLLHLGVVIGQVNILLSARKRYLNVPRKALTSQVGRLWR